MPSIPWKFADRAETEAMGPSIHSRMSTSWIECSSSVPAPARSWSPRQVEAYMPWTGMYWSSRNTTDITRPASGSCTRWRR